MTLGGGGDEKTTRKVVYEIIEVVLLWQNEVEEYFHFLKIPSCNLSFIIFI